MPNAKDEDEKYTARIVTLVLPEFKNKYIAMCEEIGENPSEHIRRSWELELQLYDANKSPKVSTARTARG